MTPQKEVWKMIPKFPNYEISSAGRVRSISRIITVKRGKFKGTVKFLKQKILRQTRSTNKYLQITLRKNGRLYCCRIHQFVLLAFYKKPSTLHEPHHKNGIKTDNRLSNLRWVTKSKNIAETYKMGRPPTRRRSVLCIETKQVFLSVTDAAKSLGARQSSVSRSCIDGKTRTKGLTFKYLENKK